MSSRWFQTHLIRPLQSLLRSKRARPTVLLALLAVMPVAALAQTGGSPFDTGFTAIQTLFTEVDHISCEVSEARRSLMEVPAPTLFTRDDSA